MEIWWKAITVVLWSAFKFMFGVITALGFNFNFIETFITTVGGGMLGVLVYLYLWGFLYGLWRKFFPKKPKEGGIKINRSRRMLVNIIRKYELYGIALLTPVLLSVPVGTLLAAGMEADKWRIKRFMFISFCTWSCVLYALAKLFGIQLHELF